MKLIYEICVGAEVSIFSQFGFSVVFSVCIVCLSSTEIHLIYSKQMRSFFLYRFSASIFRLCDFFVRFG